MLLKLSTAALLSACTVRAEGIVEYPDPALRVPSANVAVYDEGVREIAHRLDRVATVRGGHGLAAVQLGVPLRVVFIRGVGHRLAMVNPVVLTASGVRMSTEGCLSLPDMPLLDVERPSKLAVRYHDVGGATRVETFRDHAAAVVQHELDHLDGVLYIDRV